ncbi:hypothetical protein PInf_019154 [Phytophthora infestans]|nr:hypothetical protein PInf_019154 [Phytophthora infestans]
MMIKKVPKRDVPGGADRTRFAESAHSIVTAAFTGAFTGAGVTNPAVEAEVSSRTMQRSADDDQTPSLTSSAPTTVAAAVAHGLADANGLTDAHEAEDEDTYEAKAPVTVAAGKTKGMMNPRMAALSKDPALPLRVVAPTAPHKTGATPVEGHSSEEILHRASVKDDASGDLSTMNTVVFMSMNTKIKKKKANGLYSEVKQVEEAHLESEENAEDNEPDSSVQSEQTEQQEEARQPTPSQLVYLREISAVPTLVQREAQHHRRKVRKLTTT